MKNLTRGLTGSARSAQAASHSARSSSPRIKSSICRRRFLKKRGDTVTGRVHNDDNEDALIRETISEQDSAPSGFHPPSDRDSPTRQSTRSERDLEEEERDYFIPIMVVVALAGYAATALIAWVEYQTY